MQNNKNNLVLQKQYLFIAIIVFFVNMSILNAKINPQDKNVRIEIAKELSILAIDGGNIYTYYGAKNSHAIETKNSIILIDCTYNTTQMNEFLGYMEGLNKTIANVFLTSKDRDYLLFTSFIKNKKTFSNEEIFSDYKLDNEVIVKDGSINIDGIRIDIEQQDGYIVLKLKDYGVLIGQDMFSNVNNNPKSKYHFSELDKQEYKIILVGKGQNIFLK